MKRKCLAFLLAVQAIALFGRDEQLILRQSNTWVLHEEAKSFFRHFLDAELQTLKKQNLELKTLANFGKDEDFKILTSPFHPDYKNRAYACSFVSKLSQKLRDKHALNLLKQLTENGKNCLVSDIHPDQRMKWTKNFMRFFWEEAWIPRKGKFLSLQKLLKDHLQEKYIEPELQIWEKEKQDGYALFLSPQDMNFAKSHRILKKTFSKIGDVDLNQRSFLKPFWADWQRLSEYEVSIRAQPFASRPKIYLTADWNTADMVGVLAHEYGHLYHMSQWQRYSSEENAIIFAMDKVYEESVAEAFDWTLLSEIYEVYPELKVFHILKLKYLLDLYPDEPHFVGAAAFAKTFHHMQNFSLQKIESLAASQKLQSYLRLVPYPSVTSSEGKSEIVIKLKE